MLTKSREPVVEVNCEEITTEEHASEVAVQNISVFSYFHVNYSGINRNNTPWSIWTEKSPNISYNFLEEKNIYGVGNYMYISLFAIKL